MSAGLERFAWAQPILSAGEVGAFEARLFGGNEAQEWGAMQAAGRAVAQSVLRDFERLGGFPKNGGRRSVRESGRLLVLVGKGHNGGDALIATEAILESCFEARASTSARAQAVRSEQVRAEVVFVFGERSLRPLAWRAWVSLQTRFPERVQVLSPKGLAERVSAGGHYTLCLDGVFGFQFRPPLASRAALVLAAVNSLSVDLRAAVDLPSGLDEAGAFRADFTYATGVLKREVLGLRNAGRLRYLDLGFFKNAQPESQSLDRIITSGVLAPLRGWRDVHSDKRTQGHVFVLAGSREYPGAALMCVLAALRSGAGLVTAFVPESLVPSFASSVPEAIWVGWPETPDGGLALEGEYLLRERLARACGKRALVIGPGIGRERETQVLVGEVVKAHAVTLPVLLDADALQPEFLENARRSLVLTPHAGEFRRLSGAEPNDESLRDFARRVGAVVTLKGPVTRICGGRAGDGELYIYHSLLGGPVLARGGTGDLLAGLLGTQIAREPDNAFEATCRAVAWHGLAAEALERAQGAEAVRTTELLNYLGAALRH